VFAGLLLEAQSLHQEALMVFSFALSIDPDYVPGMVCMAEILRNIGGISLSSARTFLRNALRLDLLRLEWRNFWSLDLSPTPFLSIYLLCTFTIRSFQDYTIYTHSYTNIHQHSPSRWAMDIYHPHLVTCYHTIFNS